MFSFVAKHRETWSVALNCEALWLAGPDLGRDCIPDETTILNVRHLLELI